MHWSLTSLSQFALESIECLFGRFLVEIPADFFIYWTTWRHPYFIDVRFSQKSWGFFDSSSITKYTYMVLARMSGCFLIKWSMARLYIIKMSKSDPTARYRVYAALDKYPQFAKQKAELIAPIFTNTSLFRACFSCSSSTLKLELDDFSHISTS